MGAMTNERHYRGNCLFRAMRKSKLVDEMDGPSEHKTTGKETGIGKISSDLVGAGNLKISVCPFSGKQMNTSEIKLESFEPPDLKQLNDPFCKT